MLVIFFVVVAVGFLLPRELKVERNLRLKADPAYLFDQVNVIRNWSNWSPWLLQDTAMQVTFIGQSGKDAGFNWIDPSRKNFQGMLIIRFSRAPDSIQFEVDLGKSIYLNSYLTIKGRKDTCQLSWKTVLQMNKNPFLRYLRYFIKQKVVRDIEVSLANLESAALKEQKLHPPLSVEQVLSPAFQYYYLPRKARYSDMQVVLAHTFPQLRQLVGDEAVKVSGPPFVLYHPADSVSAAIEVGIPVLSGGIPHPPLMKGFSKEGPVLKASYQGPYSGLPDIYKHLRKIAAEKNLNLDQEMWESYLTNPDAIPDSSRWKTEVFFRLKP